MDAIMSERSQKRKPNWTDTEQVMLLDLYAKYVDVLGSKLYTAVNCQEKNKCWSMITEQLNDFNPSTHRTVEEVKRKWHNLLGQGRRDYLDWKRAKEDPQLPPVNLPVLSRRSLELHGWFKLNDESDNLMDKELTGEIPDEEEFVYFEAKNSGNEVNDSDDSSGTELQEMPEIKQECPSPATSEDNSEELRSLTPPVVKSKPLTRSNSSQSATPPVRAISIASSSAISARTQVNMASPQLSLAHQTAAHRPIQPSVTLSSNRPTVTSLSPYPVAMITSSPQQESSPSASSRGANHSHPSEPPWKKLRGSEFSQSERTSSLQPDRVVEPQPERGVGLQPERRAEQYSEREAELRMDILQLEKDKLWLETEKLRLEIDILRKKKQEMNNF